MSLDLANLRRAAMSATPGPWVATVSGDEFMGPHAVVTDDAPGGRFVVCENAGPDDTYIAAVSPDVLVALLDRLAAVRDAMTVPTNAEGDYRRGLTDAFTAIDKALKGDTL